MLLNPLRWNRCKSFFLCDFIVASDWKKKANKRERKQCFGNIDSAILTKMKNEQKAEKRHRKRNFKTQKPVKID